VLPLSFSEYLEFKGVQIGREIDLLAREEEIKKLFLEFLKFGGFPAVVNSNLQAILEIFLKEILFPTFEI
jgi:hypothetical protein